MEKATMAIKLSGVMLGSENPKELGEFYTEVLGKPDWRQDDWYGFGANDSGLMVGPHSEVKGTNQSPGRLITVFETDGLHSEFARIKELGAKVIAEPYQPDPNDHPEAWLATFADPDGNYFQLATPWQG